MGTLNDLLQGTSKGFWAGGAGAPVDTLTLALNALIAGGGYAGHKMGLLNTPPGLIEKPVGGSEWIAEKMRSGGLLNDNPGSTADNFGNVIGGLLGPVTAAKAPQIARGLLQGGQNLAAPRTLNPQTGAIVWHGSPHKFDKFDSSKIGTGEGAQAYGHGLYLAEAPDVAGSYAQSVKANSGELVKRGAAHGLPEDVASNLAAALQSGKKFDPVLDAARQMIDDPLASASQRAAAQRLIDNEMAAYNAWSEWSKPGQLYKVDLPDEHIAKMLDWDKPLRLQSQELQALARQHGITDPNGEVGGVLGKGLYESIGDGKASAQTAEKLKAIGVPGIRYLDGGSRGTGQGTSNFVVFPGNEGLLSILERNGKSIK